MTRPGASPGRWRTLSRGPSTGRLSGSFAAVRVLHVGKGDVGVLSTRIVEIERAARHEHEVAIEIFRNRRAMRLDEGIKCLGVG